MYLHSHLVCSDLNCPWLSYAWKAFDGCRKRRTVSNLFMTMSQQSTHQFFNKSYLGHFLIFLVQNFKVNPQVYFTNNCVAEFSIMVCKNMLVGKCWNLEGKFRNLSAKFFWQTHRSSPLIIMYAMNFYNYPQNLNLKQKSEKCPICTSLCMTFLVNCQKIVNCWAMLDTGRSVDGNHISW